MHYIVEDDKTLVRDSENGAILNTDREALRDYRATKRKRTLDAQRLDQVCSDVDEIKKMLTAIMEKLNG